MKKRKIIIVLVISVIIIACFSVINYVKKQEEVKEAQIQQVAKIKSVYLGYSRQYDPVEIAVQYYAADDYRVLLREYELDTQGVTGYINSSDINGEFSVEDFENAIEAVDISQSIKNYLLGKNSQLHFEDMSLEELKEFDIGVQAMENLSSDYRISDNFVSYISSKYWNNVDLTDELQELPILPDYSIDGETHTVSSIEEFLKYYKESN
ncbi:hypothetical protein [Streptococcus loxodontisalivarius]|uniref:Lipoprotein n=1 Tax=Streptococcus loxodontisalivarius TaxID=1349415 RepID=A0ABS2PSS6_9STRE|nr:hypothetical protein [Streptococcus loxodontisalivarius]MBM7642760.1 hypothetical protein [Streptococcus loxodontisalivarius]